MSVLSEKNRTAIYAKLNVAPVTNLAIGGVYFRKAPARTVFPYVIFDRIPKAVGYALAGNIVYESDWWSIKALTETNAEQAEKILAACEAAISEKLNLSGAVSLFARRRMDLPNYAEVLTDIEIYHHGFYLEVYSK